MSTSAARLSLKTVGLSLFAAFVSFVVGGLAMRAAMGGKAVDSAGTLLVAALLIALAVAVASLILFVRHWKSVGATNSNAQFKTSYAVIGASVLCATFGGCNGVLNVYSEKSAVDSAVQNQVDANKRMAKAKEEGAKRKEAEEKRLAALSPAERATELKAAQDKADAQKKADEVRAKVRAQEEQQRAQEKLVGSEPLRDSSGSYNAVRYYLKDTMKDPDSLKLDGPCTDAVKTKAGWVVQCAYRGKNSFGAVVRESKWFVIQKSGVVAALDESPIVR